MPKGLLGFVNLFLCSSVRKEVRKLRKKNIQFTSSKENIVQELNRILRDQAIEVLNHLRSSVSILTTVLSESSYEKEFIVSIPRSLRARKLLLIVLKFAEWENQEKYLIHELKLQLEKSKSRYRLQDQIIIEKLLNGTRGQIIEMILTQGVIGRGSREIFGNLLGNICTQGISIRVREIKAYEQAPIIELQRKRGYRDHGTLVKDSHGRREFDGSLEQQELLIKIERDKRNVELRAFYDLLDSEEEW